MVVNPHDIEGMAEGIRRGILMSLSERKAGWTAMMATIERDDITDWRQSFIAASAGGGELR